MPNGTRLSTCLACGAGLAAPLRLAGSLRCHDCRDSGAPLRRELVHTLVRLPRFEAFRLAASA
jgi:hypothetical protein